MILARGRLEALAAAGAQTDGRFDNGDGPSVRYRQQLRRCGKPNCTQCPHGPYWYAVWRDGSRVKTRYVGRELPS